MKEINQFLHRVNHPQYQINFTNLILLIYFVHLIIIDGNKVEFFSEYFGQTLSIMAIFMVKQIGKTAEEFLSKLFMATKLTLFANIFLKENKWGAMQGLVAFVLHQFQPQPFCRTPGKIKLACRCTNVTKDEIDAKYKEFIEMIDNQKCIVFCQDRFSNNCIYFSHWFVKMSNECEDKDVVFQLVDFSYAKELRAKFKISTNDWLPIIFKQNNKKIIKALPENDNEKTTNQLTSFKQDEIMEQFDLSY